MYARQTRISADPDKVDAGIENVNDTVLPALKEAEGFKGFTLLVDRESGEMVGTSYFESREALDASESAIRAAREEAVTATGAGTPEVRVFEVAIDTEA